MHDRLTRLVAMIALTFAGMLTITAGADAASISITPSKELGDKQFTRVDWSGLAPGQLVYFRQCKATVAAIETDCTGLYNDVGYSNASGKGTLYEPVHEGDVIAQGGGTFTCTSATPCTLGVFPATTLDGAAYAKVEFEPSASECPKPKGAAISGGGSDLARLTLYRWGLEVCRAPRQLGVNFVPANGPDGRRNFVSQLNDFAVTTTAFTKAEQQQLDTAKRTVTYAPITTSGLVLAYKIFDQDQTQGGVGAQVTDLRLAPSDVARIFTGSVINWNRDAEIVSRNPGHRFPPTIRPLVRGDHTEATELFTSWLTASAGDSLPADWKGVTENYPLAYLVQEAGIVGGEKLANVIADPKIVDMSNDYFGVGYIGYVDSAQAAYYGLPTAKIANASGEYVAATPDTVAAALAVAKTDKQTGVVTPDFEELGAKVYPMPVVTYATVPSSAKDPAKLTTLRTFLEFVAGDGQKSLPAGSYPLTPKLKQVTAAAAKATTGESADGGGDAAESETAGGGSESSGSGSLASSGSDFGSSTSSDPGPAPDPETTDAAAAESTAATDCAGECDGSDSSLASLPAAAVAAIPRWLGIPALVLAMLVLAIAGVMLEFGWKLPADWRSRLPIVSRRLRRAR